MKVYRTENKVNGNFYYGVTNGNNPDYLGGGKLLLKAIKKYGRSNFVMRTVKEFDNIEDCFNLEKLIVDQDLVDRDDCYNLKLGGEGGTGNTFWIGRKHTDETRKKMSKSQSGKSQYIKTYQYDGKSFVGYKELMEYTGKSKTGIQWLIKKKEIIITN